VGVKVVANRNFNNYSLVDAPISPKHPSLLHQLPPVHHMLMHKMGDSRVIEVLGVRSRGWQSVAGSNSDSHELVSHKNQR